jgi:hypothetical protein
LKQNDQLAGRMERENVSLNVGSSSRDGPFADPNGFKDELYSRLKGTGLLNATKVCLRPAPQRALLCDSGQLLLACMQTAQKTTCTTMNALFPATFNSQSTGHLGTLCYRTLALQSQLRQQLLQQLHSTSSEAQPVQRQAGSIQEQVLNTLFAEYLAATQRTCTLSVFLPEAALEDSVPLTHNDIMSILHIQPSSALHKPFSVALRQCMDEGTAQSAHSERAFGPCCMPGMNTRVVELGSLGKLMQIMSRLYVAVLLLTKHLHWHGPDMEHSTISSPL